MFISVNQLERDMGVHPTIGRFFVDRKPPAENSFWNKRLLYIGSGNGFVFIPVFYDILHRIGIPLETLLSEKHIHFMEQIMHFATMHEMQQISFEEELVLVRDLLKGRVHRIADYESLNRYLDQGRLRPMAPYGSPFPALNRADVFLYVLCDLPLDEEQYQKAILYWYALLSSYLTMDDVRDYSTDKEAGEENAIVDMGDGALGFERAFELLKNNCAILEQVNPLLAGFLTLYLDEFRELIPLNME